ncbi:hypothetical protein [Streptomyces sp. NPDC001530]|uniref:hypothetical protein n=1 Tax=Streptomyces sp. NPDC001530 TaxID=3364582 RepID=UPI0036B077B1
MTGLKETAQLLAHLRAELQQAPGAPPASPGLHSTDLALHYVRDENGGYLVPTYSTLAQQIQEGDARWRSARSEWPDSPDMQRAAACTPYPCPIMPIHHVQSVRVAVIDSGVLRDHPLLAGRLAEDPRDVTGEGAEDICGHGTVQAIRQVLYDPGCQLVVVKAFRGPQGLISPPDLLAALESLLPVDIGFVFMAGGVDLTGHPDLARRVEEAIESFIDVKHLHGNFVATAGNRGRTARWWPAESPSVISIGTVDINTYVSATRSPGALNIAQRGPLASFPDLTPLTIPQFRLTYAEHFMAAGSVELADEYAEQAQAHPETALRAIALRIRIATQLQAYDRAEELATGALADDPEDPEDIDLRLQLARLLLLSAGREDEAGTHLAALLAQRPRDADALVLRGVLRERQGDPRALEDFVAAARTSNRHFLSLQACAVRAFYRNNFAIAEKASAYAASLDPAYTASWYNQAICAYFAGRPRHARRLVRRYAAASNQLDTSGERFSAAGVLALMDEGDTVMREALLGFSTDQQRNAAPAHTALRNVLRSGKCPPVTEQEAVRLALGVRDAVERVLLFAQAQEAGRLADRIAPLTARLRAVSGSAAAEAHEISALLRLRTGEHARAGEYFAAAAAQWERWDRRRREAALAYQAYARITMHDLDGAETLLNSAAEFSVHIRQHPRSGQTVTTLKTPQIAVGRAFLGLLRDDIERAQEQAQQALDRQGGVNDEGIAGRDRADWLANVDTLLTVAAVRARNGQQDSVDGALGPLLRVASEDEHRGLMLAHRFVDLPFLDVSLPDGCGLHEHVIDLLQRLKAAAVRLTPSTLPRPTATRRTTPASASVGFPAATATGLLVAVLGTGLDLNHPRIAAHLANAADFTGEGDAGDTADGTARALNLLESVHAAEPRIRLLSVKVLGPGGQGHVSWLIQGLVWARHQGARQVIAPVETNEFSQHLLGTVQRMAADHIVIIVDRPQPGRGTVFPGQVKDHVIIA